MSRPRLKVRLDALGHGTIAIDDQDVSNLVNGFEIKAEVGEVSRVILHFIGPELDLEIETDIVERKVKP